MTTPDDTAAVTRTCVIPDFGGGELAAALAMFEELAQTLHVWEQDAQKPDGDRWRPPPPCSPQTLIPVHDRLWEALRPTQSREQRLGPGLDRVDVEPDGPQWRTISGYQLAALTFVDLHTCDLDALGALGAALTGPGLDSGVRDAVEDVDEREVDVSGIWSTAVREAERQTRGVTSSVARLNALLTASIDPADLALLRDTRAATTDGQSVRLDLRAEAAWHHVATACHRAFLAHDLLARWAMGSADHG